MKQLNKLLKKGQSLVEVIVGIAIFTIISATTVIALLGTYNMTRLNQEYTQASLLALEGVEASESIRNQNWDSLIDGNYGLTKTNNFWEFNGVSDLDSSNKYTRTLNVSTLGEERKKIISKVTWNFNTARNNEVVFTTYLTNWQKGKGQAGSTPPVYTCILFCQGLGYSNGTCRQNVVNCNQNGETYESGGDIYCVPPPQDTCCCLP